MVRCPGNAPDRPKMGSGFTDRLASLANYRRMKVGGVFNLARASTARRWGAACEDRETIKKREAFAPHHPATSAHPATRGWKTSPTLKWWTATALLRALQLRLPCSYRSAFVGMRFRAVHSRLRGE